MINAIVSLVKTIIVGLAIGVGFGLLAKCIEYAYALPSINALLH